MIAAEAQVLLRRVSIGFLLPLAGAATGAARRSLVRRDIKPTLRRGRSSPGFCASPMRRPLGLRKGNQNHLRQERMGAYPSSQSGSSPWRQYRARALLKTKKEYGNTMVAPMSTNEEKDTTARSKVRSSLNPR